MRLKITIYEENRLHLYNSSVVLKITSKTTEFESVTVTNFSFFS